MRDAHLSLGRPGVSARGYRPQLDGLRFFAVLAVVVSHDWVPPQPPWIFDQINLGQLGVGLFFVLSGFLITGILLHGRTFEPRDTRSRLHFMRQFYVRRFLRIFPLYYAVLLLIVAIAAEPVSWWPWLFTYTTNIAIWHRHAFNRFGHFWTLAVEEQFYLVWPFLLLFLRRRFLLAFLAAAICAGPVFRLVAAIHDPHDAYTSFTAGTFTPSALDSLGLGALLALASHADRSGERLRAWLRRAVLPIGLTGYVGALALSHYAGLVNLRIAVDQTAAALVFCWLIGCASHGFRGRAGRLLGARLIVYVGKISYGIYVLHLLVPILLFETVARHLGIGYHNSGFPNFVAATAVTLVLATASWELFERPLNELKRRFPYANSPPEPAVGDHRLAESNP